MTMGLAITLGWGWCVDGGKSGDVIRKEGLGRQELGEIEIGWVSGYKANERPNNLPSIDEWVGSILHVLVVA